MSEIQDCKGYLVDWKVVHETLTAPFLKSPQTTADKLIGRSLKINSLIPNSEESKGSSNMRHKPSHLQVVLTTQAASRDVPKDWES